MPELRRYMVKEIRHVEVTANTHAEAIDIAQRAFITGVAVQGVKGSQRPKQISIHCDVI